MWLPRLSEAPISTSLEAVRRLVVTKQHLSGRLPTKASKQHLLAAVRALAFVQWDPISIVAPSHVISFWSRVGSFRRSDLDDLLWDEKKLFLTWTPIASIVPTEDYPLHHSLMRRYPDSLSDSWGAQRERARTFLAEHRALRKSMLSELKKGPLLLTQFTDYVRTKRNADGWTSGSEVSLMLSYLQMTGDVMVVDHEGNQNLWGLPEQFLPTEVERKELTEQEFELEAGQKAIRALGTASPREIHYYFVRGRYLNLPRTLTRLQEESLVHRVHVRELGGKDKRYIHDEDVPLLESVGTDAWEPRLSLIAPFDNLICGRDRTNRVFGFDYVHEQFLPKNKRRFGTYLLPILWGDRLIGRVDPQMDQSDGKLLINSVHAEPGAPKDEEVSSQIAETIARFAEFLGAREVVYTARVPNAWKRSLR